MMASGTLSFLMFFVTLKSSNSSYTKLMTYLSCRAFKSFNAAENDTLLYCRVMRWADIPMLIINNIKLKTIFFITYSTLKVPSTSVICMRSKAFNISRFCFNVLVLSQLKKIRICCDSALPNSTLT